MIYQSAKASVQIFIIILLTATYGQSQLSVKEPSGKETENTFKELKSRASELERIRRENNAPRENEPKLNLSAINEDFTKIQVINTEKLQKNSASGNINFQAIAKASKDIKKRALRLKNNLFPTDSDEDLKTELKEDFSVLKLNDLIIALDNSIYHFISNPLFKNLRLLKTDDARKAQDEIKKIIIISQTIEQAAEKLQAKK